MPFGYFGAKHGLARFYPPPEFDTVVEPFAGAAGYSCYWASQGKVKHAILVDRNEHVVALWHRLQKMTEKQLMRIECPPKGDRTTEPLIAAASGKQGMAVLAGKSRQVTDRMLHSWPRLQARIARALPYIRTWDVQLEDYMSCKNVAATWFVDPPYIQRLGSGNFITAGGHSYTTGGTGGFDSAFNGSYIDLARWSRSRRGQVIVCEQLPADWLPFGAFRNQRNGVGAGTQSTRTEAIWYRSSATATLPTRATRRSGIISVSGG